MQERVHTMLLPGCTMLLPGYCQAAPCYCQAVLHVTSITQAHGCTQATDRQTLALKHVELHAHAHIG